MVTGWADSLINKGIEIGNAADANRAKTSSREGEPHRDDSIVGYWIPPKGKTL